MIFDTHTHYDNYRFDGDREALLACLPREGVAGLVAVGADLSSSRRSLELAAARPFIFASVGVHPDEVDELEALGEEEAGWRLGALSEAPRCVAIGEIGLDYHGDYPDKIPKDIQQHWFDFQLAWMKERGLPGIIHSREAAADTLDVIRRAGGKDLSLVMHCFSYEKEIARQYLDMGHYLGIGGVVTFKNGRKLKDVVKYMPLDRILLETDCPYLAPEPFRGRRNDSRLLKYVVDEIARLKETDGETVENACLANARRFYRLGENEGCSPI